jgi:hypothetical protein
MKYTFNCPMDNVAFSVEAKDDNEAIRKLTVLGKKHTKEAHLSATPMTDAEWAKFIRDGLKK